MRSRSRLSLLPVAALIAACGTSAPPASPSNPPATQAAVATEAPVNHDFVKDVDVAGMKMHVVCVGPIDTGRPTVIFEAGLGGELRTWSAVLSEVQKTDRACAYDRLGTGGSDPAPGPVTTADQVETLRALLEAIDVAPPYVLVGYSVGGWNVIVHNDTYGADIVGAVMADVRPPGVSARWLEALPPRAADEPEGIKLNREDLTVFEADPTLNPETIDLRASAAEALAAGDFGAKPLIVLAAADTGGITEGLPPKLAATFLGIWWEEQQKLADLSTGGRLEKVENATHEMPNERADAIVAAILSVLGE
jgi:pimeloyl-ACP methyl ester carboxylesterase